MKYLNIMDLKSLNPQCWKNVRLLAGTEHTVDLSKTHQEVWAACVVVYTNESDNHSYSIWRVKIRDQFGYNG